MINRHWLEKTCVASGNTMQGKSIRSIDLDQCEGVIYSTIHPSPKALDQEAFRRGFVARAFRSSSFCAFNDGGLPGHIPS
jgi:hypothetical protein